MKLQKRRALIFTLEFSVRREQYPPTSFEMIRRLSEHRRDHSKHECPFFFFPQELLGPLFEVSSSAQTGEKEGRGGWKSLEPGLVLHRESADKY